MQRFVFVLASLVTLVVLTGCTTLDYYAQSVRGQWQVIAKREPIEEIVNDTSTQENLRAKLVLTQDIRAFASQELSLPDNRSYKTYTDLQRDYVVWNVFAAPEFSIQPKTWCFPIVGCVVYRGYFKRSAAVGYAKRLRETGLDVFVGGVPAYSTLGWFNDPLLNTVIDYPEADLAGLIFHELAHQVVYAKDDSVFNESFATAVELEGVKRWLQSGNNEGRFAAYAENLLREQKVIDLILEHREKLDSLYRSESSDAKKWERKRIVIQNLKQAYERLKSEWPDYEDFDGWFAQPLNNAHFAAIASYHKWVPAFQKMILNLKGDLPGFYQKVEQLAKMKPVERKEVLESY